MALSKMKWGFLLLALVALDSTIASEKQPHEKPGIYGDIKLDSAWNPVVYLSLIPNFEERFTMASGYIVEKANIDAQGRFYFSTSFLPEEDAFYRIHISKKGDPPSTLIIGGNDENFKFFITNKNERIEIGSTVDGSSVRDFELTGYAPNVQLATIKQWADVVDSANFAGTQIKRELIENAFAEKMRLLADTNSNALVSLFALYQSDFEKNKTVNESFYEDFLEKWKAEDSEYFKLFRAQFHPAKSSSFLLWMLGAGCFIVGFGIAFFIYRKKETESSIAELSVQERKIYKLLEEGLSNKEISEAHNIGVNTVKSHVSSILSKLKMKSRKEIMRD